MREKKRGKKREKEENVTVQRYKERENGKDAEDQKFHIDHLRKWRLNHWTA